MSITLVNSVVSGVSTVFGNLTIIAAQIYQALAGVVTGLSDLPPLLPYIYHTLVNSAVNGVSNVFGNLSIIGAQIYQALSAVVDGVSNVTGNIYEYLFVNAIPSAVSALIGNLSVLGSTIGSKLRIYMRIGGGKF
jgi:phage-related protein